MPTAASGDEVDGVRCAELDAHAPTANADIEITNRRTLGNPDNLASR
jgi:hypothetical protein